MNTMRRSGQLGEQRAQRLRWHRQALKSGARLGEAVRFQSFSFVEFRLLAYAPPAQAAPTLGD